MNTCNLTYDMICYEWVVLKAGESQGLI